MLCRWSSSCLILPLSCLKTSRLSAWLTFKLASSNFFSPQSPERSSHSLQQPDADADADDVSFISPSVPIPFGSSWDSSYYNKNEAVMHE